MDPKQPQAPMQQLSIDELFQMIGEFNVQVRIANQMIKELQQEKTKLQEELNKMKENKK